MDAVVTEQPTDDNSTAQPAYTPELKTQNVTGDYWDAGLSTGVTAWLVGRLGLEVGLRGGYVHSSPVRCFPRNGRYRFNGRGNYSKVRVTDVNVGLIYRFN
jgi:hypothetical protein